MGCEKIAPNFEHARVRPGRRWNEILEADTRNNVSNPRGEELFAIKMLYSCCHQSGWSRRRLDISCVSNCLSWVSYLRKTMVVGNLGCP